MHCAMNTVRHLNSRPFQDGEQLVVVHRTNEKYLHYAWIILRINAQYTVQSNRFTVTVLQYAAYLGTSAVAKIIYLLTPTILM